jgi:hypothetical protein
LAGQSAIRVEVSSEIEVDTRVVAQSDCDHDPSNYPRPLGGVEAAGRRRLQAQFTISVLIMYWWKVQM